MSKAAFNPIENVRTVHMVCGAIAAGIVLSAGALGVIPAYQARREHRQQRASLLAVKQELDAVGAVHGTLEHHISELAERVEQYGYVLTPASELNRRLSELTALLESHRLDITELQPQTLVETGRVDYLPLRLSASGSLESILTLLETLEREHPDLHVHTISVEASGPETLRLRATLRWFVAPR